MRPNPKLMALQVENWNLKHPIGTAVVVLLDSGERGATVTTGEAYVLGGHSAVVGIAGVSGCYLLDRVTAVGAAMDRNEGEAT